MYVNMEMKLVQDSISLYKNDSNTSFR